MSELAPLDILAKKFSKKFNGYAPLEVHEYLTDMAGTIEALIRERGELRQKVHYLDHELTSFRERETALNEALVAAQRSAEATIEVARGEGQRVVDEGHGLAERLVEEANERAQNIESMINDLRNRRREARADLSRLVELLQGIVEDDHNREREERSTPQLALLHRRLQDNSEGQG